MIPSSRSPRFVFVLLALVVACSSSPPSRLPLYVNTLARGPALEGPAAQMEAGLVVINDTTWPRSAPPLSSNAITFLTDDVKARVEQTLPITITTVLRGHGIERGDPAQLLKLGKDHGVHLLVLAVFSSAESEVPQYLPLDGAPEQGGSRPTVSGFETINYALAELALLDVDSGLLVASADGRAWTSLYHLYAPVKSNSYPVIHRSLRIAPIYPREDNAKDVLRSIAGDEALEQAVSHLKKQWTSGQS